MATIETPVSYTHLDVYKRQGLPRNEEKDGLVPRRGLAGATRLIGDT